MRYMIWNNKGGVGKTLLTFLLASEYAIKNPEKDVIVIDLCPQANVSEMLLGGNGLGEKNLQKYFESGVTIAHYIKARYDKSRFGLLGNEVNYCVNVSTQNKHMPSNLYLLPGDIDLDLCSMIINYLSQAPEKQAWLKSRKILDDLITPFVGRSEKTEKVFFFDCNPSFANYTEMAAMAADRIIVPCTADAASIRGIDNVLRMIYGIKNSEHSYDDVFDTFHSKMTDHNQKLPKLHLFIQNKCRTSSENAAKAFSAHTDEIKNQVAKLKDVNQGIFSQNETIIANIKDCNTLAPIMNHTGMPISKIEPKMYKIYGKSTQANKTQIYAFASDVIHCLELL